MEGLIFGILRYFLRKIPDLLERSIAHERSVGPNDTSAVAMGT